MSTVKPKPSRVRVRLEQIIFDRRLQQRAYPGEQWFDEEYVQLLSDLHAAGVEFDPLEVVREERKGKEPAFWLIDGFNRSEALRRAGAGLVEVLVYPGTFQDAKLWSLASNAKHGKARTAEDCRKAFTALLDSAVLLGRVVDDRVRYGGCERAVAHICGISHGAVGKYLKERGVHFDRLTGKLVPNDGPASPEREARRELAAECAAQGLNAVEIAEALGSTAPTIRADLKAIKSAQPEPTTEPKPAPTTGAARAGENPEPAATPPAPVETPPPAPPARAKPGPKPGGAKPLATLDAKPDAAGLLDAAQKYVAALVGCWEKLRATSAGEILERNSKLNGVPIEVKVEHIIPEMPRTGDPMVKRTVTWQALEALQKTFAGTAAELAVADVQREVG